MEGQAKLRGKVGVALAYPAFVMVIGSTLITVMMVVVVPKVTAIFESFDRALPWYTEALIGVSHLIASNQMLGFVVSMVTFTFTRVALGFVAGLSVAWVMAWVRTPDGRAAKDGFLLKVPVLGGLIRMLAVSRF